MTPAEVASDILGLVFFLALFGTIIAIVWIRSNRPGRERRAKGKH